MRGKRFGLLPTLVTVLVFVGKTGLITPNCLGWFYAPKIPDVLKDE